MTVLHRDKVLPTQPFFSTLYGGLRPYEDALADVVTHHASIGLPAFKLVPGSTVEEMSSPPSLLAFLGMVIAVGRVKTILEIGTFTGVTAMHLARMSRGHVTTIEVFDYHAKKARENFAGNGLERQITLINRDASAALNELSAGAFDLIFIDGAKQNYPEYARQSERLLSASGVIVVDDVFFHGDALNERPATDKGRGCRNVREMYEQREGFASLLLPIGNGVLMLWRSQQEGVQS